MSFPHSKDLFVSYGRRESLGFVARLHRQLKLLGLQAWFDKVNIPDGEDYAARICHGIESAHNFAYVMAPRCLTSPYCLIELEYARLLGKRVIPVNQMVIFNTPDHPLAQADQQELHGFYQHHGMEDPNLQTTQQVLDRSLYLIGRTDWLDAKEEMSDEDCLHLATWAQQYENFWHQHEDLNYLHAHPLPSFGRAIAPLESVVERLHRVIRRDEAYVHQHTALLHHALSWQAHLQAPSYLLVGTERTLAEEWLLTPFGEGEQRPCEPMPLLCDFICESRKNAENTMTDVFICYEVQDRPARDHLVHFLSRQVLTSWRHDRDIQTGVDYAQAIEKGIEQADNFVFLLSPYSVQSDYCQRELNHALHHHKRIIPVLLSETPQASWPSALRDLQYLSSFEKLANVLTQQKTYYEQHKVLLVQALKWQREGRKPSFLLRGHSLDHAKTWLRLYQHRDLHGPTVLHQEFIEASEAGRGQLGTEVFISYSRKDSDFARRLNLALQMAGKTTWFDQESLSTGVDFEQEIFKGIASSDNLVFILSPDAVASEYCEREVQFAAEQHKRLIPLRWRATEELPETLRRIQWIDFKESAFETAFAELIQTIELDRAHAHQHTVLQQRAGEWEENQRHADFLLNQTACLRAQQWLTQAQHKQPVPTTLQRDFIQSSQRVIDEAKASEQARQERELNLERQRLKRQRLFMIFMTFAFLASLVVGGYAVEQKGRVERVLVEVQQAKEHVEQQKQVAQSALTDAQAQRQRVEEEKRRAEQALVKAEAEKRRAEEALAEAKHQKDKAETQQAQAQANAQLAEQERQRAETQEQVAQQQKDKALQHKRRAQQEAKRAQWERSQAEYQHALANLQTVKATQQARIAQREKDRATQQRQMAQMQSLLAQQAAERAEKAEKDAKQSANEALEQKKVAEEQEREAIKQREEASTQKNLADEQTLHTQSLLLVSQAENMIDRGLYLDALTLALQALPFPQFPESRPWVREASSALNLAFPHLPQQIKKLVGHTEGVSSAQFSPDGQQVVTASKDGTAKLWEVASGKEIYTLAEHTDRVNSAQFSQDGQQVVTASLDGTAKLWEVASGKEIHTLAGHTAGISFAQFSPDSQQVVTVSLDGTAKLWEVASGKEIHTLVGHTDWVTSAQFSPDGQQVVTASLDGTAKLWEVTSGKEIHTLAGHTSYVYSAQFSPDGRWALTASRDNTARLWSATWQISVDPVWKQVWPQFTPQQHKDLFLYLLSIEKEMWKSYKNLKEKLSVLIPIWKQLSPEQQYAWSYYALTWLWEVMEQENQQRDGWERLEPIQLERVERFLIQRLGQSWQEPLEVSPRHYRYRLFEALTGVWSTWSWGQQEEVLAELFQLVGSVEDQ